MGLEFEPYGVKHIHFKQIDSTNTWAKSHVDQWTPTGVTLVTASEQTAGRGRFKRPWISPADLNIHATFCFWFDVNRTDMGHIPQLLALTAAQTLETERFSPLIKWPNDLLLEGKKVGGILCETFIEEGRRGIVCGIGLNVNMPLHILNQIGRPATSLCVERGHLFEVSIILKTLQRFFLVALDQFVLAGFTSFFPLLQERFALKKGEIIQFHDQQTLIQGQFQHLHPEGSVEIRLLNGLTRIVYAGEFLEDIGNKKDHPSTTNSFSLG